jgi:hypothetical protein
MDQRSADTQAPHDLFVLSDLHMGRGINPETRRYFTLENFFFDEDFAKLVTFLCADSAARGQKFRLILNGDTFDLLRIDPLPEESEQGSRRERRFGPTHTPLQAARTVREILAGHPGFVRALAQVLHAGHSLVFLPGNHDLEIQWAPVQQQVRAALAEQLERSYGEASLGRLEDLFFGQWFYHEPGRIWVEHGCQYDPENSFRFLLRGQFGDHFADALAHRQPRPPDEATDAKSDPTEQAFYELEQDMPLGNFFQRYLFNAFGHITFIVPSTRANLRYVKWLLFNAPGLLFRVLFSHGPFSFQVLRRIGQQANRSALRVLARTHEQALGELCAQSGLGDKLLEIDGMKEVRADAVQAARSIGWQMAKFFAGVVSVGVMVSGLYLLCLSLLSKFVLGAGISTFLFLVSPLIVTFAALGGIVYSIMGANEDISPRPLRRAAQRIATTLHVPVVSFGHSHDEELWRLDLPDGARAWYCNTGTWIAVFTHDVLVPRERIQYTFLRVRGQDAELLQWSPSRAEPMPVILLDESAVPAPPA